MTSKTVAERLREINREDESCRGELLAFAFGEGIECINCRSCGECVMIMAHKLADAIEAEQAELRAENERLRKDFYEPLASMGFTEHARALAATYNFACEQLLMINKQIETDMRPEPEVLDADGAPIKVGDTVYANGYPDPLEVRGYTDEAVWCRAEGDKENNPFGAYELTHRKPDSLETLRADVEEWIKDRPDGYRATDVLIFLDRQRKLLGGE